MSIVLERKERRGDRSRRNGFHTPSEVAIPVFHNGMVRVEVRTRAAATALIRRHGFAEVRDTPKATTRTAPPVTMSTVDRTGVEMTREVLADMSRSRLMGLARDAEVPGRSTMSRDDLVDALATDPTDGE